MAKLSSSGCASGSGDHVRRGLLCGVKPEHVMTSGINIFDPKLSVEDLWGDVPLSGGALLEHVLAYYSDGELDVPFFQNVTSEDAGQSGSHRIRSVVKSPLSRELQESTVECYKQRIFTVHFTTCSRRADLQVPHRRAKVPARGRNLEPQIGSLLQKLRGAAREPVRGFCDGQGSKEGKAGTSRDSRQNLASVH